MRVLVFDQNALEDLTFWVQNDRRKALRLLRLLDESLFNPFGGIGKPEPLKHDFAGCWSKRLDDEHRVVYKVSDERILVLSCRYHY